MDAILYTYECGDGEAEADEADEATPASEGHMLEAA